MAFSRQRGRSNPGGRPGRDQEPTDRRIKLARQSGGINRRRLAFIFGGFIILIIAGVTVGLWYTQFYAPPRVKAAVINDTQFSQGDLVSRVRMIQATQGYTGANIGLTEILRVLYNPDLDITAGPFTLGMVQMELLKQAGPEYGVEVTGADLDGAIRQIFTPDVAPDQIATEDQREREFRERYESYLNFNRISGDDFRRLTEEQLYFYEMRDALGANIPADEEHVEVYWLRTPLRPDPSLGEPQKWQDLTTIAERLQEEEFEAVAQEFSPVFRFAQPNGYVGWIPKGAFPRLDPHLFGDDETEPLAIGEISDPWESSGYLYFMKVVAGPETRPVEGAWYERLKDMALQSWLEERFDLGTSQGWVEVKYDSRIYAWAAEQLRQTAQQKRGDQQES